MNDKRKTLSFLGKIGAVAYVLPSQWVKPMVASVIVPAHAQTSEQASPVISSIESTISTQMLEPGSVVSLKAVISDADSDLSAVSWNLLVNGKSIAQGKGQFPNTDYTVLVADGPDLLIELEVTDESSNSAKAELFSQMVGAVAPTITDIQAMVNTQVAEVGSVLSLRATIGDIDSELSAITWTLFANGNVVGTGMGQFPDTDYTIITGDDPNLKIDLEARDESGNSVIQELFAEQVLSCDNFPAVDSFVPTEYLFDDPNRDPNDPPLSLSQIQALNGMAGNLFFANTSIGGVAGSSELTSTARQALDVIATSMIANPGFTFAIQGNTAECGTNENNIALGQARAQAVFDYIIIRGAPANAFSIISYGEERPFCIESTISCWQSNSRVAMILSGRP